jgi:hypothetical protein
MTLRSHTKGGPILLSDHNDGESLIRATMLTTPHGALGAGSCPPTTPMSYRCG